MAVPAVAMSEAGTVAVTLVLLTNVVVRLAPFHFTTLPCTKLVPFTVRVNCGPPAVALLGESEVAVGTGLLMVKFFECEVPPPGAGFITVTGTVPALAMSEAVIAAVTFVLLTKVVVRAEPFHCTTEVETKFVPVTVRVNAVPPAVMLLGESDVSVGTGLLIVKLIALEVPPPGGGFITVTGTRPALAMSEAVIAAVTFVLLTKVVVRAEPFHCTTDVFRKFVPFTVSVKAARPPSCCWVKWKSPWAPDY